METKQYVLLETIGRVGLITFNRPQAYHALNAEMLEEIMQSLQEFDQSDHIGAMVLTGNEKSFAAGADISQMADASQEEMESSSFIPTFSIIHQIRKPIIAAVSGFCLGGGNELALSCDLIVASETASFGQPEINLGIIPGAGGTQRLTRLVGKYLAMEMILNDRKLSAEEAHSLGLVNRIYPLETYLEQALSLAQEIASRAPQAVMQAKQMINQSQEVSLQEGLQQERAAFYDLFSTQDQKEGMQAFLEKRKPDWTGR